MSISVNIVDPKSCRLSKLMKAISEYVAESGNGKVSLQLDLNWKSEKKKDAD